jgi:hypothetical protein
VRVYVCVCVCMCVCVCVYMCALKCVYMQVCVCKCKREKQACVHVCKCVYHRLKLICFAMFRSLTPFRCSFLGDFGNFLGFGSERGLPSLSPILAPTFCSGESLLSAVSFASLLLGVRSSVGDFVLPNSVRRIQKQSVGSMNSEGVVEF